MKFQYLRCILLFAFFQFFTLTEAKNELKKFVQFLDSMKMEYCGVGLSNEVKSDFNSLLYLFISFWDYSGDRSPSGWNSILPNTWKGEFSNVENVIGFLRRLYSMTGSSKKAPALLMNSISKKYQELKNAVKEEEIVQLEIISNYLSGYIDGNISLATDDDIKSAQAWKNICGENTDVIQSSKLARILRSRIAIDSFSNIINAALTEKQLVNGSITKQDLANLSWLPYNAIPKLSHIVTYLAFIEDPLRFPLMNTGADLKFLNNQTQTSWFRAEIKFADEIKLFMKRVMKNNIEERRFSVYKDRLDRFIIKIPSITPIRHLMISELLCRDNELNLRCKKVSSINGVFFEWRDKLIIRRPNLKCLHEECDVEGIKMKVCSCCEVANYCSPKCQKLDWKRHKDECPNLDKQTIKSGRLLFIKAPDGTERQICTRFMAESNTRVFEFCDKVRDNPNFKEICPMPGFFSKV